MDDYVNDGVNGGVNGYLAWKPRGGIIVRASVEFAPVEETMSENDLAQRIAHLKTVKSAFILEAQSVVDQRLLIRKGVITSDEWTAVLGAV